MDGAQIDRCVLALLELCGALCLKCEKGPGVEVEACRISLCGACLFQNRRNNIRGINADKRQQRLAWGVRGQRGGEVGQEEGRVGSAYQLIPAASTVFTRLRIDASH